MSKLRMKLEMYLQGFEPVRARDWALAVALPLIGIIAEAINDWDTATGWYGLFVAVVIRLTTKSVRDRTTTMTRIEKEGYEQLAQSLYETPPPLGLPPAKS